MFPRLLTSIKRSLSGSPRRRPARQARPEVESLEDRRVLSVTYNGGAVLSHVQAQALYLGSDWISNSTYYNQSRTLDNFLGNLVNSSYMDMLGNAYGSRAVDSFGKVPAPGTAGASVTPPIGPGNFDGGAYWNGGLNNHWKGDELDVGPVTLTVKGNACTVVTEKGTKKAPWRIKLDAAKQPKQIDFLGGGEEVPGIYKLEGTTLLICQRQSGMDRPSTFAAEGDDALFVFRRLTPADGANERAVKVGNIAIVGNTKTKDAAILKKIPLRPGDALDYQALRTAKKNLAALNATITVIESGEDADYKDIRVTVVEK